MAEVLSTCALPIIIAAAAGLAVGIIVGALAVVLYLGLSHLE